MKEINIGKILVEKRKEKGITQEELAAYIGVSKASVSKWETGQSYPDITFLPHLAAYFNVSIDDLIGYTPQMSRDEIRKLYNRLAKKFSEEPFEEAYGECEAVIKKYYACFPLLLQMIGLYLNHFMLAPQEKQSEVLAETLGLCQRVKAESDDIFLAKDAASLEALCYLLTQTPEEVLALYGERLRPISMETEYIAQAYLLMGKTEKAREAAQASSYQHLLTLLSSSMHLLSLSADDPQQCEEIIRRLLGTAELWNLKTLHPNTMALICLTGAQVCCSCDLEEKALELLHLYAEVCKNFLPFTLHGDEFFDSIDGWIQEEFELGNQAPRSEDAIRQSLIQSIEANPAFASLSEKPEFKTILLQIKTALV